MADFADLAAVLERQWIELPSWAFGNIPWDQVDDFDKLRRRAEDLGLRLGTVDTTTFQDDDDNLGSPCHVDRRSRAKAVAPMLECVDIMDVTLAHNTNLQRYEPRCS